MYKKLVALSLLASVSAVSVYGSDKEVNTNQEIAKLTSRVEALEQKPAQDFTELRKKIFTAGAAFVKELPTTVGGALGVSACIQASHLSAGVMTVAKSVTPVLLTTLKASAAKYSVLATAGTCGTTLLTGYAGIPLFAAYFLGKPLVNTYRDYKNTLNVEAQKPFAPWQTFKNHLATNIETTFKGACTVGKYLGAAAVLSMLIQKK